jgi:predicted TPR repeat methyltransferase
MKVMEFGAGTGLLNFYLKDMFSEINLVDSSQGMLRMAEEELEAVDRLKMKTLFLNAPERRITIHHRFPVLCGQEKNLTL